MQREMSGGRLEILMEPRGFDAASNSLRAYLAGPITELVADLRRHPNVRQEKLLPQANDDHAQCMCKFANGANGFIVASRVAHGKKMGLCYEIHGTKGAIQFDQEDQNSLYLYRAGKDFGFQRILAGPGHGSYAMFCQGLATVRATKTRSSLSRSLFINQFWVFSRRGPLFQMDSL